MNNNSSITIVTYHIVREMHYSRYPEIKGLDISLFKEQLGYFKKHYTIISMEQLIDALDNGTEVPRNSLLLTFDDGYKDHFNYVFPVLNKMNLQGSFFPTAKAILENKVLDVNKIHFILASEKDKNKIVQDIFNQLDLYRKEYNLLSNVEYFNELAIASRFDTKEVIFIKRLLQYGLIEKLRNKITDYLFRKYVGIEEKIFSKELYMDLEQIKCMVRNGMHFGAHGYDHNWLASLSKEKQKDEINLSLRFLELVGVDLSKWTMCYPYGSYNEHTIKLLEEKKCKLTLTINTDIAYLDKFNRYELPRLDTNDFPKSRGEKENNWTLKVL